MPTTVLGAGAWGLTLAARLARNGHPVTVWGRNAEQLARLDKERATHRPPGLALPDSLRLEPDLARAISGARMIACAAPSFAVRPLCRQLAGLMPSPAGAWSGRYFVSLSKGIEEESLLLPSQVFAEAFGDHVARESFAVLAGPSHAEEVSRDMPTTVVVSSRARATAEAVREAFAAPKLRIYVQEDVIGTELGGALKNVIAIAAGVCDGLQLGDNIKAALITRGVAEVARAGKAMGAQPQTLAGLAGLGDLIVTTLSRHSRNRNFGELFAQGIPVDEALQRVGGVVEGYRTSRSAHALARTLGVEMPLIDTVHRVLFEGAPIAQAIQALFDRDPKHEWD